MKEISFTREEAQELVETGLDAAISTIGFVQEVVPLDMAQNALGAIKFLLTLIRDTVQNKKDFAEFANECREIGLVLWHGCANLTEAEDSRPLVSAIEGVQATIDRICAQIEEKARRNFAVKLFHSGVDKDTIRGWQDELAKCLNMFNTKLNVMANVNVINMKQVLEKQVQIFQAGGSEAIIRQPPPPVPALFFGRDALVQQSVEMLLKPRHLALWGPGGQGKSSLAKAILSDFTIVKAFRDERYFVAFDDIDTSGGAAGVSLSTFFSRLASALGLRSSQADVQKLVMHHLQSRHALIVLDNAETFLHAGQDSGRISAALDEIGAIPTIVLLFTTRSAALPPNLLCEVMSIPALDLSAARETFSAIHQPSGDMSDVDYILAELEYHPLSVTLLAQAARQNQWQVADIVDAWREQKTRILQTNDGPGAGKSQSLSVTVDITLNSNALRATSPAALQIMQVAAFFPRGINRRKLKDLFPNVPDVSNIVNLLCKLSLLYPMDNQVTMLAPIRAHILSEYGENPDSMPLFAGLRSFYRKNLREFGLSDTADRKTMESWFSGEGSNVAYMIMCDLDRFTVEKDADLSKLEECYCDCYFFLKHITLFAQRSRPLEEKILQLPDQKPRRVFGVSTGFASRRNRVIDWKADCLVALGNIAATDTDARALELFDAALQLKRSIGRDKDTSYILSCKGSLLVQMEHFKEAKEVLTTAGLATNEENVLALIHLRLSILDTYSGGSNGAQMAADAREKYGTSLRETGALPGAILYQGRIAYLNGEDELSKRFLRECIDASKTFSAGKVPVQAHLLLADIAVRQGKAEAALQHVKDAMIACEGRKDHTYTECIASRASLSMDAGDFEAARTELLLVLSEAHSLFGRGSWAEAYAHYRGGRLELLASNLTASRRLFKTCLQLADALSDIGLRARTLRAIGELDILDSQPERANEHFRSVVSCCEGIGLNPHLLYRPCPPNFQLPDRFNGWLLHLKGV